MMVYLSFKRGFRYPESKTEGDHLYASLRVHIITQSYGGQMTRAIRNMMVQQCWAGTLQNINVSITEPFSIDSKLVQTPETWTELKQGQLHTAARFSDYYDLPYYNMMSMQRKMSPLVIWENFLDGASRTAIAVSIPTHSCSGSTDSKCTFSKSFLSFVNVLVSMGFKVARRVCIPCSSFLPYKLEDLSDLLFRGNGSSKEVTIIIDKWRNFQITRTWLQIPDYCKLAENPESSKFLVPSSLVIHHSNKYIGKYIKNEHFVAIMLRIERFLTLAASGRSKESVGSCLKKTMLIHDNIQSQKALGTYITVDIGKYGSGIMQNEGTVARYGKGTINSITEKVEVVFRHMYEKETTLEDWEETFVNITDGIVERGYIAMLQRNIASKSDCLILMGGGSFQQIAGYQYIHNCGEKTLTPCLHTVCALASFTKLFNT